MTIVRIRELAAVVLVLGHVFAIGLVFFHLHAYFETAADKMEIALILSPLTGLFALAGLKYVLTNPSPEADSPRVGTAFAVLTLGLPITFIAFICYTLLTYPFGVASDASSLRITLSATEVALGAMVGAVAERLFGVDMAQLKRSLEVNNDGKKG